MGSVFADANTGDRLTLTVSNADGTLLTSTLSGTTLSSSTTLTLDFLANQSGGADVTVRGTDAFGLYVEDTFHVTVNPVNDAPTFALPTSPNQTSLEDAGAQTVSGFATSIFAGGVGEDSQALSFLIDHQRQPVFRPGRPSTRPPAP